MDIVSAKRTGLLSQIKSSAHKKLLGDFWKSEVYEKINTKSSVNYVGIVKVLNEFNRKGIDVKDKSLFALETIEEVLCCVIQEMGERYSNVVNIAGPFFVEFLKYPRLPVLLMKKHKIGKEKGAVGYLKAVIDPDQSIDSPKNRWLIGEFKKVGYPVSRRDSKKTEKQVDNYVARCRWEEQLNATKLGEFDFGSVSAPDSEVKPEPAEPEPVKPEGSAPKFDYPMLERTRLTMSRDLLAFEYRLKAFPCFVDRALLFTEWAALKEWGDKEIRKLCH